MNSAPVQRVEALLADSGYRALRTPLAVGGIPFGFNSALVAEDALDLVLVIDTIDDRPEELIRREVDGLARALDAAASRRPLSVILTGPRWSELTERALGRVARVLICDVVVGGEAAAALRDSLAVLLPLAVEQSPSTPNDSWAAVREKLQADNADPALSPVIEAAPGGMSAVEREFIRLMTNLTVDHADD